MAWVYKEADFPAHYREAEVRQIMSALFKLRSIAITGLAGMGKSNVVRFIVSHPLARARYWGEQADDWVFVHVDCAGLAFPNEAEILNEIVFQLHSRQKPAGTEHAQAIQNLRRAVKGLLLDLDPDVNLAVILDYFDPAAGEVNETFFNFLAHLRNTRPKANLAYVFVTRRPMEHLFELEELLDDPCVIGPLGIQDALDSIRRDEARLGYAFTPPQRDLLIACTGGHPGLLKNAGELLSSAQVDGGLSARDFARQLLRFPKIDHLCRELWRDLTPDEQRILANVAQNDSSLQAGNSADVSFLVKSGLVKRGQHAPQASIFCPLFAAFVQAQLAHSGGVRISAVFPNQAHLHTATSEKDVTLSPKLFALLRALAENWGKVVSTDELIARVYGDEAPGVTNAALSQLVKRLRGILDPHLQETTGDPAFTCVETIRDVGYRLYG